MIVTYEGVILAGETYIEKVTKREEGSILSRKSLDPRYDLRNHSPDGFSWGYFGSGPLQIALAIVADAVSANIALRTHIEFTERVISRLPAGKEFVLNRNEVRSVIDDILEGD